MRRFWSIAATPCLVLYFAVPAVGAPMVAADLNTWASYDQPHSGSTMPVAGNWDVNLDGTVVVQTVNGKPTFLASPEDVDGQRVSATFTTSGLDNDFFGMAFGFSTSPSDSATEYLLIDWRQADQPIDWLDGTGPVTGTLGLAVSRVSGVPTLNELWGHTDSAANTAGSVAELARGTSLGGTGWVDNTAYDFVVEYTTTSLDLWVDGSHEISITGVFPTGPVALYNFSQPGMTTSNVTFQLLNDPPEILGEAPDVVVDEGQIGSTSGAFIDPDDDALTLSCSGECVGFADQGDGTWSWSQALPEGPEGFTVTVTASDGDLEASDEFDVTVNNVAPVIVSTSSVPTQEVLGSSLAVSADFTDVGVLDTHVATFNWGDGSSSAGAVTEIGGSGTTTASHQYTDPGFYTITVTVWDDDGASDTATIGEVFVFDPNTFVTGGGWVDSPQGAWTSEPAHIGKATFGFVVRYDRSGVVRGNLEFQLHRGLNLHSSGFDFLLINGGMATFEGWGTVNGDSGYGFVVVATDERLAPGDEDLFWITVTGPAGTVYDGSTLPSSGLPIVGRGIQIHEIR